MDSGKDVSKVVLLVSKDQRIARAMDQAVHQLDLSLRHVESYEDFAKGIIFPEGVVLYVMDMDNFPTAGIELCYQVRSNGSTPLIGVGSAGDKGTVIKVLKAGADYYLSKPVDADLLVAYLGAALRRRRFAESAGSVITVRDLTIDNRRKEIRLKRELVPVTRAEYRLLSCLARNLGKVISCSDLVLEIGGYSCPEQEAQQIVKVHVSRLRNKIDVDPSQPSYIVNVRGFGYLLERRSPQCSEDS